MNALAWLSGLSAKLICAEKRPRPSIEVQLDVPARQDVHLIHELLPPRGDGLRWANSDPITGQAAWFDLKVRIAKAAPPEGIRESQPQFPPILSPVGKGPDTLTWKVGK